MESTLCKINHNPAHPAGLGSVNKLSRAARQSADITPTIPAVKQYLKMDDTYMLQNRQQKARLSLNCVCVCVCPLQHQAQGVGSILSNSTRRRGVE